MFEVSAEGLKKLIKDKARLILELVQNAWDEKSSTIRVGIEKVGRGTYMIVVTDDNPEGFKDLSHAYTLYADSEKKKNPDQRGRFNEGEKRFIAACEFVSITSTTGQLRFENGIRTKGRTKRDIGTEVVARIKLTEEEYQETINYLNILLTPKFKETSLNGVPLISKDPVSSFEISLPTVTEDENGFLKDTVRKAKVEVFEPIQSGSISQAYLYEMGIPVVEIDCRWSVNVHQKVPLNRDRDNVTPSYKKKLYVEVMNHTVDHLNESDSSSSWVKLGASNKDVSKEALGKVLDLRFGPDRVSYSVKDQEANSNAVAHGFRVIHGSCFSGEEWENIKKHQLVESAEKKFPTPKPYSPDADKFVVFIPESSWTAGMKKIANYSKVVARHVLGEEIKVKIAEENGSCCACYGGNELTFFVKDLGGERWFNEGITEAVDELIIHELGHHYESNHLSSKYHEAICKIGAKLKRLNFEAFVCVTCKLWRLWADQRDGSDNLKCHECRKKLVSQESRVEGEDIHD